MGVTMATHPYDKIYNVWLNKAKELFQVHDSS
ncbi:hypothetical protein CCACVL1_22358 [Corchorus capsularis]|uniref:Uncharacterized protein n=1 Tax=Corchorus capsularis TaxID=210143 RepID=A0A1R3GZV8_COCAP|nr:hypothetical protein CCACVL1_22358 [Corchorus capsularis]